MRNQLIQALSENPQTEKRSRGSDTGFRNLRKSHKIQGGFDINSSLRHIFIGK